MLTRPNKASKSVTLTYNGLGEVATRKEANGDLETDTYDGLGALLQSRTTTGTANTYTGQIDELHKVVNTIGADGTITSSVETTTERNIAPTDAQGRKLYTVQEGDTLGSIAARLWDESTTSAFGYNAGPSSLWYKIAQANSAQTYSGYYDASGYHSFSNSQFYSGWNTYGANTALATGMQLVIPDLSYNESYNYGGGYSSSGSYSYVTRDINGNIVSNPNYANDSAFYAQSVADEMQRAADDEQFYAKTAEEAVKYFKNPQQAAQMADLARQKKAIIEQDSA